MLRFERVVNTIMKEVISPALFSIFVPIEIYDRTRVNPRMNTLTIIMMLLLSICVNDKRDGHTQQSHGGDLLVCCYLLLLFVIHPDLLSCISDQMIFIYMVDHKHGFY